MTERGSTTAEPIRVELTDDEREVLLQGLGQWGGPADLSDPMAVAMGFASRADFSVAARRLSALLEEEAALTRVEWRQVLLATEIVFVSDVVGAGWEWPTVTGLDDDFTLRILRGLQQRLPALLAS